MLRWRAVGTAFGKNGEYKAGPIWNDADAVGKCTATCTRGQSRLDRHVADDETQRDVGLFLRGRGGAAAGGWRRGQPVQHRGDGKVRALLGDLHQPAGILYAGNRIRRAGDLRLAAGVQVPVTAASGADDQQASPLTPFL